MVFVTPPFNLEPFENIRIWSPQKETARGMEQSSVRKRHFLGTQVAT